MIFTRSTDEKVTSLVTTLDKTVNDNKDKKLAAFVNVLNDDFDKAKEHAEQLDEAAPLISIPLVVPKSDFKDGPKKYGLPAKADVTVILYKKKKVQSIELLRKDELTKEKIKEIVADAKELAE
jgi:hypothetical protein